uniref:Uncharacterized protein n=1 Tax=Lepeophtheirus salmonis TaxID=72036 RepID=A0A0K2TZW7_LEPSM
MHLFYTTASSNPLE